MSALSEEINTTLIEIIQGFASPNNEIRSAAETRLNQDWITAVNIEVLLIFLAEQAAFSQDLTTAAISAVLFRKLALRAPPSSKTVIIAKNITHISENALTQIRATLLKGFMSERPKDIRHKLSDAIAECAQDELPEWTELLQALVEFLKNTDPFFRESSFRILASVPHLINAVPVENIIPIFESGFTDDNDEVKISAVTAFVGYFKILPKKHWSKIGVLLPSLLNSLPKFLDDNKDDALASVFESLIELAELAPKLFKDMFDQIIQFSDIVIKNTDLETHARTTALELLTVFSENAPHMCKSNGNYAQSIVTNTLLMMTEVSIDDDEAAEWHEADDTEDDEEVTYDHARQALDRVSLKLGGEFLAPTLFQYLQQMVGSSQWRERFGAMMALSSAAEGCQDVLIAEIPKVLDMIIPLISDPHPRVQYGCCNALGQISTDFSPLIQRTAHDRILPALISRLTSSSIDRVQTHAAAALVNFSEQADQSILEPYLDSLLNNLLILLQSNKLYVQEQALTTIAFIAEAAKTKFIKYYDTLMPLLLNVLKTDNSDDNGVLKGKCIECATLIAAAVGKQKFSEHSQELINLLLTHQNSLIDEDDSIRSYLEHGWGRICRILGDDFVPLLPIVLPPLLETAKATQDVSLIEEEEAADFQKYSDWDVVQIQGKHIAIHTSILDDKVSAMELLQLYASILKTKFANYVKDVLTEIAIPSIDFYLHDGVRATGATLIPVLLSSIVGAVGLQNEDVMQLWNVASAKLIGGISTEPMLEITQAYHSALVDSIAIMQYTKLAPELPGQYAKGVQNNLSDIYERVKQRHSEADEYNEEVDDEFDVFSDEDLLDEINKSLAAVMKSSSEEFLPQLQSLWPLIHTYLIETEVILVLFALVALGDIIQYYGELTASFKDSFISTVLTYLVSPDPQIRQGAAYVIGACSQYAPNTYGDVCISALNTLIQVIQIPDAKTEENQTATENSSSSIAKLLYAFNSNIPNVDTYISSWFKSLPTTVDDEAAAFNYIYLGHLINSKNPVICEHSNIPNIVEVVIQALHHKSITGKNAETITTSVKQLLGTLPPNEAMGMLERYPAEYMPTIQAWFS
ncbi:similar to Saccharomyces cerevisiae YMR308C PSE1 Karyopherin/importin that interacts with the nuclear pore complex [Maudiozyma barnettii]|uniref:Similar to Saccharomyces cerevisiae YMR308C PSE1 Karyopherin/importin that interacts with the nuclear pore complex n=1 Tax=Maudiozyma barnettii TaxID=61262 RepID=A0A8H2VD33_9SACH|nr:Pse1p [Kazachstania barnettii]CAB4253038.1 similar to Saccharomyces cerevisiae YMR308C PSE1 Karyopherin/importin that interacts with the nuclear pore complex [Kazachstania barnettii]CAD1780427.1 similar to Saccharomyces cerevisiae YMR308C PSE1 Karyopherin/importin that interacts with the nuclear pore complex [Kazachstania barnettii]